MTVKGEYIRRTLLDESNRWLKNQNTVLATKLHSRTGRLVNERSMSVSEQGEMSATMTYQHTIEERFLDMRVLRYGSKPSGVPARFTPVLLTDTTSRLLPG